MVSSKWVTSDYEFSLTMRGKPKIIRNGYHYTMETVKAREKIPNATYWRCTKYFQKCTARAKQSLNGEVSFTGEHNHLPDIDKNKIFYMR